MDNQGRQRGFAIGDRRPLLLPDATGKSTACRVRSKARSRLACRCGSRRIVKVGQIAPDRGQRWGKKMVNISVMRQIRNNAYPPRPPSSMVT